MLLDNNIESVKGFLAPAEGQALYRYGLESAKLGPCLEIGSYCGKSTVYLGQACRESLACLFAVDHHRGSEEHQLGEEYHDGELYDAGEGLMDSFKEFRKTLRRFDLESTVVPVVASSDLASRQWATPLSMVFIDGGHSDAAALCDYRSWAPHIVQGGVLAIHDLFPNPDEGGQAPYTIWKLALASGLFEEIEVVNTLGFLRRV